MLAAIPLVIALAHDYALETRIRRLLEAHAVAGDNPRTLVMNSETLDQLLAELEGTVYQNGYWWMPAQSDVGFFLGIPILVKDYVAFGEILVGV